MFVRKVKFLHSVDQNLSPIGIFGGGELIGRNIFSCLNGFWAKKLLFFSIFHRDEKLPCSEQVDFFLYKRW